MAYAIYPDRASFEAALEALRAAGFRNSDISAILPERDRTTKDLAHEINTKAPEGAAAGAGTGAAVGGVLGWLVGIGALAIPGIGPLVAAGPVVAALAGAGAGGATGGLVGGLIGAGIPEVMSVRPTVGLMARRSQAALTALPVLPQSGQQRLVTGVTLERRQALVRREPRIRGVALVGGARQPVHCLLVSTE